MKLNPSHLSLFLTNLGAQAKCEEGLGNDNLI